MKRCYLLKLAVLGASGLCATVAGATALYSNGPVVGANGKSVVELPAATLGFSMRNAANFIVAEDFAVAKGSSWVIDSIDFFAYQSNATRFTFQTVVWNIMSGDINTGTTVASGATTLTDGGFVGYRVSSAAPAVTSRPIYQASADIPDVTLGSGAYWLTWSMSGSLLSGPWQPSTADGAVGNAMQSAGGARFVALADASTEMAVSLPFVLNGSVVNDVPEPSTPALALVAGLALVGATRLRRAGRSAAAR